MSLGEHLEELRTKLIQGLLLVGALTLVFLSFGKEVHSFLISPYRHVLGPDAKFIQIQLMAPFVIYLKSSFLISVLFALPILLYLLWTFVAPAVSSKTELWGKAVILFSTLLFWSGLAICWFLVFEDFLRIFLVVLQPEGVNPQLPIEEYYDIFFNLHLVFGSAFQLPIVLILLGRLGIISSDVLFNRWRESVLIIALASAILSPGPDVFSMCMLLVPLVFLFLLSAFFMKFMELGERDGQSF